MTLSQELTEWGLGLVSPPESVRKVVRRHILDAFGSAIAARRLGVVDYVVEEALSYTSPDNCSIIGSSRSVPSAIAALANGTLIHALDFDDTHPGALIHGSAVILPAVLAVAQDRKATFGEAVDAMIVGLETTLRIGRLVPHGFHARGFHPTSIVGIYGATLAAARLMQMSEAETVHALGLAGSKASGTLEFLHTGASTKQIHPGWAGLSAVLSARLAERGATGPATTLDGRYGLFRSFLGVDVDGSTAINDLGQIWEATLMTIKPYPVCQLSHASLDACQQLLGHVSVEEIAKVQLRLPKASIPIVAEPHPQKTRPRTPYEAKFSVQWNVAALLVDGRLGVEHFTPEQLERPEIARLASAVEVMGEPLPGAPAEAPGDITILLNDGTTYREKVDASSGSPTRPMPDSVLQEKFLLNVGMAINAPEATATAILDGTFTDIDVLFADLELL